MAAYFDTFAYALLPNHFHIVIKVKSGKELVKAAIKDLKRVDKTFMNRFYPKMDVLKLNRITDLTNSQFLNKKSYDEYFGASDYITFCHQLLEWIVSERFRRFMLSYAKAINKQEERTGSLFQKRFKRKLLEDKMDWCQCIMYVHRNPIHHGMALSLMDSDWTSYNTYFSNNITELKKDVALSWFDGIEKFKLSHENYADDWKHNQNWWIED